MKEISFYVTPEQAKDESYLEDLIAKKLQLDASVSFQFKWHKRSIDARNKNIRVLCTFHVFLENERPPKNYEPKFDAFKAKKEAFRERNSQKMKMTSICIISPCVFSIEMKVDFDDSFSEPSAKSGFKL